MIEIGLMWLLIAAEVFLVLLVAVISLLWMNARRRRADRQAAMFLVGVVKEREAERVAATREVLEQRFGYSGDALETKIREIIRTEKLLFQRVINMYVKRDVISMRELNIDVETVTEPFRTLDVQAGSTAAPAASAGSLSDEEAHVLRNDNESLKQELQITMETMSRMLGEYASMFGGGSQSAMQAEAMQQALSGSADDDLAEESDIGLAAASASAGEEVLQELDDDLGGDADELMSFEEPDPEDAAVDPNDETVLVNAAAPVDLGTDGPELSDEDLDALFDEDGDLFAEPEATKDSTGTQQSDKDLGELAEMDDELADIWADALGEQEEGEAAQDKK